MNKIFKALVAFKKGFMGEEDYSEDEDEYRGKPQVLSQEQIDMLHTYINGYLNNKFLSKQDISFSQFPIYQEKLSQCKHCNNIHNLRTILDNARRLDNHCIQFRCVCKAQRTLSMELYKQDAEFLLYTLESGDFANKNHVLFMFGYDFEPNSILFKKYVDFLEDQERLHKLFLQKEIDINYFDSVLLIGNVMNFLHEDRINKYIIIPSYNQIKSTFGYHPDAKLIIRGYLKYPLETQYKIFEEEKISVIAKLLSKFDLTLNTEEISNIIEEISIDDFEETLGKEKIPYVYDSSLLSGIEFEKYIKNIFEALGHQVTETPIIGDQGADLILDNGNDRTVVQIKNHSTKVSNKAVQEIVAAMRYYNANKAVVVVSSSYTQGAIDLAKSNNVELWDESTIKQVVKQINEGEELEADLYNLMGEADTNADAYHAMGEAQNILGDYDNAIKYFNKALELNSENGESYRNRGIAKGELGDHHSAIDDYNRSIELNPYDARPYYNRAAAKLILGEYGYAIQDYDKAIELNPTLLEAYGNRGVALMNIGAYPEAIENFNRALELSPEYELATTNRGLARMAIGEYGNAIEDFNKAIQLNPDSVEAYAGRGLAHISLGQNDSGCIDLSKAGDMGFSEAYDLIKLHCK